MPGFVQIAEHYGVAVGAVQLTFSTCLLGLAVGGVIWGPISDRFGRKRPMLMGLSLFVIASLLIAVAPSLEAMIALRLVEAVGGSAGIVIGRAMVRDRYAGAELARAMSFVVTVFALVPVAAPALGAVIVSFAPWQAMFVFLAVYGLGCVIVAALVPETLPVGRRTDHGFVASMAQYRQILTVGQFRFAAVAAILGAITIYTYLASAAPVFLDAFGTSVGAFGIISIAMAGFFAVGAQINMRLLRQYAVRSVLRASVAVQLASSLLILATAILHGPLWLFILVLLPAHLAAAGVNSNSLALAIDPFPKAAASAAGLVSLFQMTIGALVAAILAMAEFPSPIEMGAGMTAATAISSVYLWQRARTHRA